MGKQLRVVVPHPFTKEEAANAIRAQMPHLATSFGKLAKMQDPHWEGDTLSSRITAFGLNIPNTLEVADDHIVATVDLPWMLSSFAGLVESKIRQHSGEIFAHWSKVTEERQRRARRRAANRARRSMRSGL